MNNFSLFLPRRDIIQARSIRDAVMTAVRHRAGNAPLKAHLITDTVDHARFSDANMEFGALYAGQLVAKYAAHPDDLALATGLLRKSSHANCFGPILAGHVERHGGLQTQTKVFGEVSPFAGWKKATFYSEYMDGIANQVARFAEKNRPPDEKPAIFDIGTGDGVLITRVINRLANLGMLSTARLMLNDQSSSMIASAADYCRTHLEIPVEITAFEGRIENIAGDQAGKLAGIGPFWFQMASASIHHMPKEQKIRTLGSLKLLSRHFLIAEFAGNHDVTEADSPELFYSVANFYGPIFDNILKGTATEEEKWSTINDFLLAEAVIILRSCNRFGTAEEAGRVDYHTTASEWKRIADAAGYRFKRYEPLVRIPNGGRTVNYFMQFEA